MPFRVALVGAGTSPTRMRGRPPPCPESKSPRCAADSIEKAARLASLYGASAYDDYAALLGASWVSTPSCSAAPRGSTPSRESPQRAEGSHVLTEKPIDVTVERADALIETARAAKVALGVLFQDRAQPSLRRLQAELAAGRLGRPLLASARVKWYRPPAYYAQSSWRGTWALDGGGALMNQGIHTIDLLGWLLGPGPPGDGADRDAGARDRGRGYCACPDRVHIRRPRHLRGDHRRVSGVCAARRVRRRIEAR